MNKEDMILFMSGIKEIGHKAMIKAFQRFSDADEFFRGDKEELEEIFNERVSDLIIYERQRFDPDDFRRRIKKAGAGYIIPGDAFYPLKLSSIYDPPLILYYIGDISMMNDERCIGIVGSRSATHYGLMCASGFAAGLAEAGVTVISGMALGIDGAAHRGCLRSGGRTVAVLGSGIDVCYPGNNIDIYERIKREGLILSEHAPGVEPYAYNFPLRNRLISGLSDGVLVIEARKKSGSLITAEYALEQGRNVYAVPGRIDDRLSEGTNKLITDNAAVLCPDPGYILKDLYGIKRKKERKIRIDINAMDLSDKEKRLYKMTGSEPVYVDTFSESLGITLNETISILIKLEQLKLIRQADRGYYIRAW